MENLYMFFTGSGMAHEATTPEPLGPGFDLKVVEDADTLELWTGTSKAGHDQVTYLLKNGNVILDKKVFEHIRK